MRRERGVRGTQMNKLAKGAIAGAAGIALLLGGAGTFAFWNSSQPVSGGTITAGNLLVEQDGAAGVWTNQTGNTINIATYRVVPGDVLTFTDTLNVTAVGNTLKATLSISGGSVAPASAAVDADVKLAQQLTGNAVVTASGDGFSGSGPTYTVTAASGTGGSIVAQPVVVKAVLTFPFAGPPAVTTADNSAKLGVVNLTAMAVDLTQIQ
jgi:alternate signal-mediated exported protein